VPIKTFRCADTQKLFSGYAVKRWAALERQALRKLEQLEWSERLEDLRIPAGNRLEALKGKRKGQYSIRINDQWRLCFRWSSDGAYDVEIVDYH
jgi:toxin HigB-1